MVVDVVELLRELDIDIAEGTTDRSWHLRSPKGASFLVEPIKAIDRITSHAVRSFFSDLHSPVSPLFVGRTITPSMLEQAKSGHIDVLTEHPLQLILGGIIYANETHPPNLQNGGAHPDGPHGFGGRWVGVCCFLLSLCDSP